MYLPGDRKYYWVTRKISACGRTMHPTSDRRWYSDVTSSRTTKGGPCVSYRPYVWPDGRIVYVLQVGILRKTAGRKLGELEEKLNRGEIPLTRAATEDEISWLNKTDLPKLPGELASIVNICESNK